MNLTVLFYLILLNSNLISSDVDSLDNKGINWIALGGTSLILGGTLIYLWPSLQQSWWKQTGSFHWETTIAEMRYKNIDQFGHVYVGMELSKLFTTTTEFWNLPKPYPEYIGPSVSTLFLFSIEMKDAYTPEHGFSKVDILSNTLGAWYPFMQKKIPQLKHYNLKYNYWKSDEKDEKNIDFVWDYGGMTYWISADIAEVLPFKNPLPKWLNPAFGYGTTRHSDIRDAMEHRELYFGLDLNLEALPGNSKFLKRTKSLFNGWHFPMPAVKIYPDTKFYLLFWGP